MEVVSLDDMDGFEFERFIAHLFERLGFGKAEEILKTGDAGRDIVIRTPDGGLIIVECKHHPEGTIGRPVVQKLHSAVITVQAKKGFLVTTGRFSLGATEYASSLGSLIEMVDSRILYDMAKRAQIRVLKKGEKTTVYHILPPSQKLVEQKAIDHIIGNALSNPNKPHELTKTEVINTHFTPVYLLEYSLHENFSTTVGIVHRLRVDRERILLNGQDGGSIDARLAGIVAPSLMTENWYPHTQANVSSGSFKLGYSAAKQIGIKRIRNYHTKTVGYYGANKVRYTKTCVPQISNILVQSLAQVYLPLLTISCRIVTRQHLLSLYGNENEVKFLKNAVGICEICRKELGNERLLCNSCGRIVHTPGRKGHGYLCEMCDKTICKECAYWTRKYLFLKKKLCESCADKLEREGKKVKKLA